MSEDDEDYSSSDEDSSEEFSQNSGNKLKNQAGKRTILTLEDNDDDASEFQRPDLAQVYEDDGEDDGEGDEGEGYEEMEGEDETLDLEFSSKKKITTKESSKKSKPSGKDSKMKGFVDDSKNSKKKKKKKQIGICMVATKYECVRRMAKKLAFKEVEENEDWSLFWTDTSVSIDRVNQMKKWQKINHYPGMSEICRKDFLTRNMNRMMKLYPKDYTFYPKAWCMPADYADFINYARLKKNKTYICKPDSGCQGRGIFLTKNPFKDIKPGDNYVAQVYISRPFTVDGFKFDLRVYVAVTSCDPFRIFVYKEGLARFTTQSYEEPTQLNCKDVFMHLTNYAIQKRSEEFVRDEETGTKRRISTINKWLKDNGYDVDKLWADIDDVVIKVLLSAHAVLKHNYRTCFANHYKGSACFEILGYDILVDKKLKPYVLEVNHSPSFTTDSKLDREIKDALIYDTIMLVNIGAGDKRKCVEEERKKVRERLFLKQGRKETKEELDEVLQDWLKHIEKWEDKHMGNFRRVYPGPGTEKYDKFFNTTGTLFSETAASRARIEQAKQQMEEISKKNEKFIGQINKNQNKLQNREVRGESPIRKASNNQSMISSGLPKQQNNSTNQIASANANRLPKSQSQQNLTRTNTSSTTLTNITNNNNNIINLDPNSSNKKLDRPPSFNSRLNSSQPLSNVLQPMYYVKHDIDPYDEQSSNDHLKCPSGTFTNNLSQLVSAIKISASSTVLAEALSDMNIKLTSVSRDLLKNKKMLNTKPRSATSQNKLVQMSSILQPSESWKPTEINEYDEMERIHALKQRETLIKGMGINEIVNKILSGTGGTVASLPPAFLSYTDNNINNHNNNNSNSHTTNLVELNDVNMKNSTQISKLELRTKNFNPFENHHSLFAEKYINNQQVLKNNIRSKTNGSSINVNKIRAKLNTTVSNNSQSQYQDGNLGSNYRYQYPALNNEGYDSNVLQRNIHSNESNRIMTGQVSLKTNSNRYPVELFTKADSSQQTNVLNGYRIKSAQNLAKQKSSESKVSSDKSSDKFYSNSLYIFSYHAPTRTVPPE